MTTDPKALLDSGEGAKETPDLLERLARLYEKVPELVPEGVTFVTAANGPCIILPGFPRVSLREPWFLDLALGRLVRWLLDHRWRHWKYVEEGQPERYKWVHAIEGGGVMDRCPYYAAISAAEIESGIGEVRDEG